MGDTGFIMNKKLYDVLKVISLVFLPALATLYVALGGLWNFPAVTQVVGTIAAIDTVLGLILNKSSQNYINSPYNLVGAESVGKLVVIQDEEGAAEGMRMEAYKDPFVVPDQQKVVFDVGREQRL